METLHKQKSLLSCCAKKVCQSRFENLVKTKRKFQLQNSLFLLQNLGLGPLFFQPKVGP